MLRIWGVDVYELDGATAVKLAMRIGDNVDYDPEGRPMGSIARFFRGMKQQEEYGNARLIDDKELAKHAADAGGEIAEVEA